MNLTIKNLLEELKKYNYKVLAGYKGLDNIILAVDDMEIPNIDDWIIEGELLITTGYSIKNDEDGLLNLIKSLKKAKGSGIILKTRFIGEISEREIECANKLCIPLIQVPDNVRFAELKKHIYMTMARKERELYLLHNKLKSEFRSHELGSNGFNSICLKIYQLTGIFNYVVDNNIRFSNNKKLIKFLSESNYIEFEKFEEFKYSKLESKKFFDGKKYVTIYKISRNKIIEGYLICETDKDMLDDKQKLTIMYAIEALSLEYNKTKHTFRNNLLEGEKVLLDLMLGKIKTNEEAEINAKKFFWPRVPFSFLLFVMEEFNDEKKSEAEINIIKTRIIDIIRDYLSKERTVWKIINVNNHFEIICEINSNKRVKEVCLDIITAVKKCLQIEMTGTAQLNITRYIDINKAYSECRKVMQIKNKIYPEEKFLLTDNLILERGFFENSNIYFEKFIEITIGELIKYDKENNTNLYNVLRVFAKNNAIKNKTAKELFLHRNTLSYKLDKIEKILDIDLSDEEIKFKICLAIFIKELS